MTVTGPDDNYRLFKNPASGYIAQGDGFINAPYIDMSVPFAAGALRSNTEELLRFEQALDAEKLLKRRSLDEMYTPFKEILPGTSYAFGWRIGKTVRAQDNISRRIHQRFCEFYDALSRRARLDRSF